MIELEKDIKTAIVSMFHIFRKVEGGMNMLERHGRCESFNIK